jgi:hypothetical protein
MRVEALEKSLSEGSEPLLSLYLEFSKNAASGRSTLGSPPWLKKVAKSLASGLPKSEQKVFAAQVNRVDEFLANYRGTGGLAIFASPSKWICLHLPAGVTNELYWGKPALSQLIRIAGEQHDVCVIVVDRAGARFFRYELGELIEMPSLNFEIDASQWKRREHGHMARRNTKMPHGPLRDAFAQRMEQQYQRFYRHIAERAKFICAREHLDTVFLVGSERLTKPIGAALPKDMQERAVRIPHDIARIAPDKLQAAILPKIAEWTKHFAEARADRLLESERGAVVGFDETLADLQKGRIGSLLIVRGLDSALRQCVKCGDVNRSADPQCQSCGGDRRTVTLVQVIDELAKSHRTRVEFLDPDAAKRLVKAGGMGGWLRQPTLVAAR